jgi:hypothetical protein
MSNKSRHGPDGRFVPDYFPDVPKAANQASKTWPDAAAQSL